jgi:hypothetical protein
MFSVGIGKLSAPMRLSAWFAAMKDVGGEDIEDGQKRCSVCGRGGDFVVFSDFGAKRAGWRSGYRLRL